MTKTEFTDYIKNSGFKMSERKDGVAIAAGIVSEVPLTITYVNKKSYNMQVAVAKDVWKAHSRDLKAALKGRCSVGYGNALLLSLKLSPEEDLMTAIREVISSVKNCGIKTDDTCPFCKKSGCDIAVPYNGAYRPAHRACLQNKVQNSKNEAEKNASGGSYITGIIGAVLGMIVGIIPSFYTVVSMEKIYVYLFALIPLAAYYGYKLLNGKLNKVATLVTVIVSILGVYVLEFAFLGHQLMIIYGISIGDFFSALPMFLTDPEIWAELTNDAILEFVFVILGIVIVWKQISRTSAAMVADDEKLLDLSLPYGTIGAGYDTSAYGDDTTTE